MMRGDSLRPFLCLYTAWNRSEIGISSVSKELLMDCLITSSCILKKDNYTVLKQHNIRQLTKNVSVCHIIQRPRNAVFPSLKRNFRTEKSVLKNSYTKRKFSEITKGQCQKKGIDKVKFLTILFSIHLGAIIGTPSFLRHHLSFLYVRNKNISEIIQGKM